MCAYSMMADYGRSIPPGNWDPNNWSQFKQVLDAIKALDTKMGLADCPDPMKAAWMADMEKRMAALEAAQKGKKK